MRAEYFKIGAMFIELDPPTGFTAITENTGNTGITDFRFGMRAEEVKRAAAAIGEVTVMDDGVAKKWTHMRISAAHPQIVLFFHLEDGRTLTAVEVFRPQPGPEEITVTWRGIDVFATRAEDFFDRVEQAGYRVSDRDDFFPTVSGLTLGMSRDPAGDDEFPMNEETHVADYFLRVLAAPADYYDAVLAEIERMGP